MSFRFVFLFVLAVSPELLAAEVSGTVLDPHGARVPYATVHLLGGTLSRTVHTDVSGAFRFPAPPDGAYQLLAAAPGLSGRPQRIQVAGGAAAAELRLELAARTEVVVVTAERSAVPVSATGSSTTVLTRAELDRMHAENVAEALRHVPGLALARTGRRGATTGVFARGGESDFNLVMIDGVKVNDFGGAFNFAHLPIEMVERIEVVRGPQSAVYGLNAIGAVIHIITRRPARGLEARGEAEGGSFGTVRGSLGAGGQAGRFGWNADLTHHSTNGVVPNDDYRNQAGALHLSYDVTAASRLRYTLMADANEVGSPGPYRAAPLDRVLRGAQTSHVNGLEYELQRGRVRQKLAGSFFTDRLNYDSAFGASRLRQFRGAFLTETQVALGEANVLAVGFEYQRERFRSNFVTDDRNGVFPLFRNNLGWFAENRYERGGRLFLNTGVRVENIRTSALPPDAFGSRPATPARSTVAVSPKLSVAFLPNLAGGTRLHGSAGTGLRAPDGFELAFTNNGELRPERTVSFDLGLEQEFARRRAAVDLTYFYNRYHDLIITVRGDLRALSRYQSDNLSNARAQGLELSGTLRPAEWLELSGHYTWLRSEVLSLDRSPGRAPAPFRVGDPLIRRPEHSGAYTATWRIRPLRLALHTGAVMRSAMSDVDPVQGLAGGVLANPGYVRPDLGAEVAVTGDVSVFGRLYNFTDNRYEEALGFPALRRNFVAGLKFRWR